MPDEPPRQQAFVLTRSKQIGSASSSGIWNATSIGAPSRLPVIRPWPMPSVIEEPLAFSSPVLIAAVERGAHRIGEADHDAGFSLLQGHADARERAARADRADEAIDLAVRLSQISGPVVCVWPSRLAVLSNWFAQIAPFGSSAASSSAMRPEMFT